MKKTSYPCPCGGKLKWKKDKVIMEGIDCGVLDVEYCPKCGEEYLPDGSMVVVEKKLKEAGLWGVKRKPIKFWKSGNSVVIRLPTEVANELHIKDKTTGHIYAEGDSRLIIEV